MGFKLNTMVLSHISSFVWIRQKAMDSLVYSFTVISTRYHLSIAVRYLAIFAFIFSETMPCTGDYTAELHKVLTKYFPNIVKHSS